MDWSLILNHSILMGIFLSVVFTVLVIISLMINKEIWLNDYPPDVKKVWGPISEKGKQQRAIFSTIFFAVIIIIMAYATMRLNTLLGGSASFGVVFTSSAIIFLIVNLVDAVIIDWLILLVLWPGLGMLPGTEGMERSYRDVRMHLTNFAKGFFIAAPMVGLITAGIASLVAWVRSLL